MSIPDQLAVELTARLRRAQAHERLPSLSVAVFRAGEVVWVEAAGLANAEDGREATPDTQYRIGSITKTFVAAAIFQLRDEGRLGLDDPLSKHVPDAPHGSPTLGRMLAHASGLQREFPDDLWETMEDPPSEELLTSVASAEQVLGPGEHWHYSNLAYALLGEVVSRVSGQPATEYVEQQLLRPLGLRRTTWLPEDPHAQGYFVQPYEDALARELHVELRRSAAIGQLWSTTADLARWGAFMCEPERAGALSEGAVELMHSVQIMAEPLRWSAGWGYGLSLLRRGDRIFGGHGGAMPGFLAYVLWSRSDRTGAAVLTNSSVWPTIDVFALELAERAIELWPVEPEEWRPDEPPPDDLTSLLGRWWTEGNEFVLSYRRGRLEARLVALPQWRPPAVFAPEGKDRFRVVSGRERGELLTVARDEAGEPVRLYWATYPCTRAPEVFGSYFPRRVRCDLPTAFIRGK